MKIDKQALRISELEELNELLREKVKKLESDLWDKEQLRQVYSEKSFNLDSKVRELEARNQKDFVWRGNEISRLNDEVDELKEKLEAAEQANKLAQEATENLVQERNALAAENTALKKSEVEFNEYCRRECEDVGDTWVDDFTETPATDAFLAEVRASARNEGINYAASRLAAAFNHGFLDKPVSEFLDVTRMILSAKESLANDQLPADDGLSGEYAEKSIEEWANQLRKGGAA
ncbi:ead/Ea22-like family protein [Salmonella enterica subsp. enterica serovar Richmond]|nr:ead/Ea22-like family protein [Salmonella enterica subsp. enterica serovar Richmond]ECJ3854797.1 ead/Ea22-like family protein [Salmonella enterica subsp. enterica serovar Richmond]